MSHWNFLSEDRTSGRQKRGRLYLIINVISIDCLQCSQMLQSHKVFYVTKMFWWKCTCFTAEKPPGLIVFFCNDIIKDCLHFLASFHPYNVKDCILAQTASYIWGILCSRHILMQNVKAAWNTLQTFLSKPKWPFFFDHTWRELRAKYLHL